METLSFIALALSAATLVVTILIAIRLKTVHYLLQQPVVKKMSPQLRLKPVKLDEAGNRNRAPGGEGRDGRRDGRPEGRENREGREGGRPEGREGRRDGRRDNREGRPEGERREGRDRREGRPEGERRDGREGGRPEGRRENREGREGRPEGERREGRPEGREGREGGRPEGREGRPEGERREGRDRREGRAPRESGEATRAPREYSDAPAVESSPAQPPAGLPPRRPLGASSEAPARSESQGSFAPSDSVGEATFVGGGDDVQHGRRTQLKKKPKFDIEEDAPATPAS